MFALAKLASDNGVHFIESIFWRQLACLPVVVAWLWWNNDLTSIATKKPAAHVIRMVIGISAMMLNFWAITLLPMVQATTIGFVTPIFATILATILLKEPTGIYRWSAVLLGFFGVLIALQPDGTGYSINGAIIGLAGALLTAGVAIQLRRMAKHEQTGAIVFWFGVTSLLPVGIAAWFVMHDHSLQTWLYVAGLSMAGAISQILLTASLRYGSVSAILTMDYSSLIWAVLLGWLVFNHLPGQTIMLGAAIIIGAGLIIVWREHHIKHS
jgi:drug/metabolite transporter (DMT)-like permease